MIFGNPKVTFTTYPELYGVIPSQSQLGQKYLTGIKD